MTDETTNQQDAIHEDVTRQQYRKRSDLELTQIAGIKERGNVLIAAIASIGSGHELRLARDRVEEAIMWSIKAISKDKL